MIRSDKETKEIVQLKDSVHKIQSKVAQLEGHPGLLEALSTDRLTELQANHRHALDHINHLLELR